MDTNSNRPAVERLGGWGIRQAVWVLPVSAAAFAGLVVSMVADYDRGVYVCLIASAAISFSVACFFALLAILEAAAEVDRRKARKARRSSHSEGGVYMDTNQTEADALRRMIDPACWIIVGGLWAAAFAGRSYSDQDWLSAIVGAVGIVVALTGLVSIAVSYRRIKRGAAS